MKPPKLNPTGAALHLARKTGASDRTKLVLLTSVLHHDLDQVQRYLTDENQHPCSIKLADALEHTLVAIERLRDDLRAGTETPVIQP